MGDVARWALDQTNGDVATALPLTAAIENIIASGAGALGGVVGGNTSGNTGINALNGADQAAAVEQYNMASLKLLKLFAKWAAEREAAKVAEKAVGKEIAKTEKAASKNAVRDGESAGGGGRKTSESEKSGGDGALNEQSSRNQDDISPPPQPRNESDLSGGPLENATKWKGSMPLEGGPKNGTLYRADNKGNVTTYATYDEHGMILKRVDVTGKAHGEVSTPHVLEYGRNILPDHSVRVNTPKGAMQRPARMDEIP